MKFSELTNRTNLLWPGTFSVALIISIFFSWAYWQNAQPSYIPSIQPIDFAKATEPITPIPLNMRGLDQDKVKLGYRLFNDTMLSGNGSVSCATCHALETGGTDNYMHPAGMDQDSGLINTLSVFNCGFNFRQFWNGRSATLEEQINEPFAHPLEMDSNWDQIVAKLQIDRSYLSAFSASYADGITPNNIRNAIATYERSLITPNARFDKYLRGDKQAITAEELAGYNLFKSYGCINCHQGVNVGGNMYEKLGIMLDYFNDEKVIQQSDMGRYAISHDPEHMHEFKVPGLRNVALTAPYFHDGSADTLDQAVGIMGKYQLGLDLPKADITRITAFLKSLTGEYNGKPL